jgi:hypothetical protein
MHFAGNAITRCFRAVANIKSDRDAVSKCSTLVPLHCNMHRIRAKAYFCGCIAHCINEDEDRGIRLIVARRMSYLSGGFRSIAAIAAYSG